MGHGFDIRGTAWTHSHTGRSREALERPRSLLKPPIHGDLSAVTTSHVESRTTRARLTRCQARRFALMKRCRAQCGPHVTRRWAARACGVPESTITGVMMDRLWSTKVATFLASLWDVPLESVFPVKRHPKTEVEVRRSLAAALDRDRTHRRHRQGQHLPGGKA